MAIPILLSSIHGALLGRLGEAFLAASPLCERLHRAMWEYEPYHTSLVDLQKQLLGILREEIPGDHPDVLPREMEEGELFSIADDLMGLVFAEMVPFEANFVKINDYSMKVWGIAAPRILVEKYANFYSPEEMRFLRERIRTLYPAESWRGWLEEKE